jgi:hypothetical protein
MKIRLDYVSVSVAGDYYQVMFEDKEEYEGDEILDTPYVLIQRQFEMPEGSRIYIETHDENFVGHFVVIRCTLGRKQLSLQLRRKRCAELEVRFSISHHKYMELKEALRTMIPRIELLEGL